MIIVSQDRDLIINFDNVTVIGIAQNNSKEIDSITVDKEEQYLGEYKTEERAKEVLAEIIKSYRDYRTAECDGYTVSCNKFVLQETVAFEMPED